MKRTFWIIVAAVSALMLAGLGTPVQDAAGWVFKHGPLTPPVGVSVGTSPASTTTVTPTKMPYHVYLPLVRKNPLTVVTTCRLPARRSDATVIADGILRRESDDPLLDLERRAELSQELGRVLSLVRGSHSAVTDVHPRDPYASGRLVAGLTPTLRATVESILGGQEGPVVFKTGSEAFDTLNRRLGLRGVELHSRPRYVVLCFDDHLNAPVAAGAYSALEEVRYANPDDIVGDGPDVDALRDGDVWYIVFRDAWGDCPAGCIYEKLFFFTVANDEVVEVEPSEALADPRFQELVALVRYEEGQYPIPDTQQTATSTVYVPLVLRKWERPRPNVVWGTQFGPDQERREAAYNEIVAHELPLVQAAGFTSIRTHLYWRDVEPENTAPDAYDWSRYDQRLQDFQRFGLEPVVSIVGYPLWAMRYYCGGGILPGMESEWREFVRAAARRYSVPPYDVHIWEVGNEVDGETEVDPEEDSQRPPEQGGNQPTWPFGGCWGDMAPEYVGFLRAAYQEIKAVDPTATVMMGGLAYAVFDKWFIRDFFDNFLAAGGAAYTDVVGFHWFPYRQPWATAGEKAGELRGIMAAHGVSKPLWLTETYMWDREDETDTRDLRFNFITQELPRAVGSGAVERIYWFGFWDFDPSISTFDRGLTTVDHKPKPGLKAFEIMTSFANGRPYLRYATPPGIEAYRFIQPWKDQETWTIWSTTGGEEAFTLPVSASTVVEAVRIQAGNTYTTTQVVTATVAIEDGRIALPVGPETLFLHVEKGEP